MYSPNINPSRIALRSLHEAIDRLEPDKDQVAMVAGIGCSGRLVGYVDFCTLHTTHGRAPAFATGLKLVQPELEVIVLTGDGDGLAIGGNHLIHAARRNVDMTCLLFNNATYGMTGGQIAPMTPQQASASTAPFGNAEPPFDTRELLDGTGASFVARVSAAEPPAMVKTIAAGIEHQVYSLAAHSQAYGPPARSGVSRPEVVIASASIGFPLAESLDILVMLSDDAYRS